MKLISKTALQKEYKKLCAEYNSFVKKNKFAGRNDWVIKNWQRLSELEKLLEINKTISLMRVRQGNGII